MNKLNDLFIDNLNRSGPNKNGINNNGVDRGFYNVIERIDD